MSMVLAVIQELESQHPDVDIRLMALTTGHLKAKAVRSTLGYRDFLHLTDAEAAREWGQRLGSENSSPDVPVEESVAYLGINYLDLVAQLGVAGAADAYRRQGRYAFQPLPFMRRVLAEIRPDIVVATNSPRTEQAALDAAAEIAVPTVGMIDLFGLDSDTYVGREHKPDFTCVISEVVRTRLIERGFPGDGVVVTGNPGFDGLFSIEARALAERFLAQREWARLKVILYAGHVEPRSHPATPVPAGQSLPIEIESILREHVRHQHDLALIVRHHPSDWHTFPRLPAQDRVHFSEPPLESIHPLILAADVVAVQTSTVGLESAVAGRPVVSVENSPAAHIWFSLAEQGVATPCATPADLPDAIEAALASGDAGVPTAYRSDGRAARRVVRVIEEAVGLGRGRFA